MQETLTKDKKKTIIIAITSKTKNIIKLSGERKKNKRVRTKNN